MAKEVTLTTGSEQELYGIWGKSNDKTVSKDIPKLSKKFYEMAESIPKNTIPFYVLSRNYNEETGSFELFIGGTREHSQLERYVLPEGLYGTMIIKPKLGFLWGMAIGEAKRYFYTQWLPNSNYKALNMEYELHTEKSLGKKSEISLLFAIQER